MVLENFSFRETILVNATFIVFFVLINLISVNPYKSLLSRK